MKDLHIRGCGDDLLVLEGALQKTFYPSNGARRHGESDVLLLSDGTILVVVRLDGLWRLGIHDLGHGTAVMHQIDGDATTGSDHLTLQPGTPLIWAALTAKEGMYWATGTPKTKESRQAEIEHPAHYQGRVQSIDAIESALGVEGFLAYARGNVLKYGYRAGRKGSLVMDLAKAAWYANRAIEVAQREGVA